MSTASTIPTAHDAPGEEHGNGHDPHLAHHFDTPEQQFASGKLGMWVFLATEILMFGGLFCAYSVYRHNHPDVFEVAHKALDKPLGAINTIVLITSSLTMAWGVRLAQLGRSGLLVMMLALTILGGYIFMGIKTVEYKTKWAHGLGVGQVNVFRPDRQSDPNLIPGGGTPSSGEHHTGGGEAHGGGEATPAAHGEGQKGQAGEHKEAEAAHGEPKDAAPATAARTNPEYVDPNAGTGDAALIRPAVLPPAGLAPKVVEQHEKEHGGEHQITEEYKTLSDLDKERTYTFFQVYFLMTGLHGIHVLVGMALIFWILVRAVRPASRRRVQWLGLASVGLFLLYVGLMVHHSPTTWIGVIVTLAALAGVVLGAVKPTPQLAGIPGEFGPEYFTPVDIVGLYWHLVDLIWIFLFPLLYLIH
jgi:cytochrome c oxidase subunit 3